MSGRISALGPAGVLSCSTSVLVCLFRGTWREKCSSGSLTQVWVVISRSSGGAWWECPAGGLGLWPSADRQCQVVHCDRAGCAHAIREYRIYIYMYIYLYMWAQSHSYDIFIECVGKFWACKCLHTFIDIYIYIYIYISPPGG